MLRPKGYVAIATLLVITALISLIGLTVSILGVDEGIVSLSYKEGMETLDLVYGCAEDALSKINALPSTITLPIGSCTVSGFTTAGLVKKFTLTGTIGAHTRQIYIEASQAAILRLNIFAER